VLAVEMTLLGGRYRASSFDDRRKAEWPPEPARLFYAAVNVVYQSSEPDDAEVEVLRWWETLGAPEIACSEALLRSVVDHYVPGNFASSWTNDIQPLWREVERHQRSLMEAQSSGSPSDAAKAQKALDKVIAKVRTATERYTRPTGKESLQVMDRVAEVLPHRRGKQPRTFPTAVPDDPNVYFIWRSADPTAQQRSTLDAILGRIGRVGHSASTVSCRITDDPPDPVWVPTSSPACERQLRTTDTGLLEALLEEYERHHGYLEHVLPARLTGYVRAGKPSTVPTRQNEIGDWIILRFKSRQQLPISRTLDVARAVRAALISHAPDPVPPLISGHIQGSAEQLRAPHMSVLCLPNVTHAYSDGYIQAAAICLPDDLSPDDRTTVLDALDRWSAHAGGDRYRLTLPGGLSRDLELGVLDADSGALPIRAPVASRQFWARRARTWSSVTPVALDRHPRIGRNPDLDELSAAVAPIISRMCERVGLPVPESVTASPVSVWSAVPPVAFGSRRGFPQYCVGGRRGDRRFTTHVTIEFPEDVRGPLIIGAGRYFGYGLLLPTPGSTRTASEL